MTTFPKNTPMRLTILLFTISIIMGCDPKVKEPEPADFSCIYLYDSNGIPFGTHGACDLSGQWEATSLTTDEKELLQFADTISTNGLANITVQHFAIWPLPLVIDNPGNFSVRSDTTGAPVKIKITIVDESANIKWQRALLSSTNQPFALLFDGNTFQAGQFYRLYYRVEGANSTVLLEGYGNIMLCNTFIAPGVTTIEMDCL